MLVNIRVIWEKMEILGMETHFVPSSLFEQASEIIYRGKIRFQSNPLKRYQNAKTSIATSKAQSQYLKKKYK